MVNALQLTKKEIKANRLFVINGSDALLRDMSLKVLGKFKRTIDAGLIHISDVVGQIESHSVAMEEGSVLVKNVEQLKEDARFDSWLHRKQREKCVVLLVSIDEKLNVHYSRVVGRRGLIINCDIPNDLSVVKRWVRERAARKGVRLSPYMVVKLIERSNDLMVVDHTLDMIGCGGKRIVTEFMLDELMMGRGIGVFMIAEAIFNRDKKGIKHVVETLRWGMDIDRMIYLLTQDIMMRIRVKELGVRRASQELKFDRRFLGLYFGQASQVGVEKMWIMIDELNRFARSSVLKEVNFLRWLFSRLDLKLTGL